MSERYVNVRRTAVAFYRVPIKHYDGMTEEQIKEHELALIEDGEVDIFIDNIVDEKAEVWFDDLGEDGAK